MANNAYKHAQTSILDEIIIDNFAGGGGSSRIAAYDAGLDFVGYEIWKEYFDMQEERFQNHIAQMSLFVN